MATIPEREAVQDSVSVDVHRACDDDELPHDAFISDCLRQAVACSGQQFPSALEIAVRIVSASDMQALNSQYRGKDKPTNVLSFAAEPLAGLPVDEPRILGDIVVCAEVVRAEAATQGKTPGDHWAHMLIHGALHLLGHDHEQDAAATAMEALEIRALAACGVANPYVGS